MAAGPDRLRRGSATTTSEATAMIPGILKPVRIFERFAPRASHQRHIFPAHTSRCLATRQGHWCEGACAAFRSIDKTRLRTT